MQLLTPAALATALYAAACLTAAGAARAADAPGALPSLGPATVLLVVAPHPDDETLCCAGVIQRVLEAGGRASIVWVTSGDGSELGSLIIERSLFVNPRKMRAYAERRMREARAATALLGVGDGGRLFLGYPDGGLRALLGENRTRPYRSGFTDSAAVPYPGALFPGHPYTGESLARDFAAVLERTQPTLILAPSPLDSHPDHRAAGLLTIAASNSGAASVRYWIVHGGEGWPSPRGLVPGIPLTAAPLAARLEPVAFALSVREEDRKLAALKAYETQLRVTEPFLLAFVRTTELFSLEPTAPPAP